MAELQYSPEAISVLRFFHGVDVIVLVEGEDDVPFWEAILEKFAEFTYYSQPVGGKPELLKYVELINLGKLDAIVAMDRDYDFLETQNSHANILRTYGYSIENSLVSSTTIRYVIEHLARVSRQKCQAIEVDAWLDGFCAIASDLIIHDIGNYLISGAEEVAGDNCARFMKTQKSPELSASKIDRHLNTLHFSVTELQGDLIVEKMSVAHLSIRDVVRGHFLFSAVYRFVVFAVEQLRGRVTISIDALLGVFMMAFRVTFSDSHAHHQYYKESIAATQRDS